MRSKLAQGGDEANEAAECRPGQQRDADAATSDYRGLLSELIHVGRQGSVEVAPRATDQPSLAPRSALGRSEGAGSPRRDILRLAPALAAQRAPCGKRKAEPGSSGPVADQGSGRTASEVLPSADDPLTGLSPRPTLTEKLKRLLASRHTSGALALLWIDLHRFRTINDRFGYRVGDRALKEVAQRLRTSVGEHDLVARVAGDEFVVLQEQAGKRAEVEALARHVASVLDRPFAIDGHRFTIGACIGVARLEGEQIDAEGLMRRADQALQEAKKEGRRSHHWFDGKLAQRARLNNEIRADLAMAIVREELALNYQPIVDLAKRRVIGFEALLRWDHPVRGRINPSDFIPVAEETGLILPISDWVLKMACREAINWPDRLKVSVNLSPMQFKHGDPAHSIDRALAASGLRPQRLECEITESTIIQDVEQTLAAVRLIKSRGVTISLDDFGTGYSSLNCLSLLPFDRIKIDRSFVTGTDAGKSTFAILETIATLGRALGVTTVLEGVETTEQLALAVLKGCSAVQGYLFSPPCSADRALDIIADVDARAPLYLSGITIDASL